MTTTAEATYAAIETHTLAQAIAMEEQAERERHAALDQMRIEMRRRIEDSGGTELPDEEYRIALKPGTPTYDVAQMLPLLEMDIPAEDFDKAYSPRHQEWVDAKWNGSGVNALERKYGDAARVIGFARVPGVPKVVVEKR